MNNRKKGALAEENVVNFLQANGFLILDRNFYAAKFGEIDIVASKEGVLHFIEVKSAYRDFEPIYNISRKKLNHLINSINFYLKSKRLNMAWVIDVAVVKGEEIELLENVTI
ncbi:MAG: YraN family protein [Epsilonproteobacteria bacterium]|nr:YraN family protein [Campylobacterota bacterium]